MKDIAIIAPVYNCEKYLDQFINSVIEQSFKNFDFYLIDDGSTDKSKEILIKYAKCDSRLIILAQENSGASAARNSGVNYIIHNNLKYKFIYFIDSDDYIDSELLERSIKWLKSTGADMAITGVVTFNKVENFINPVIFTDGELLNRQETINNYFLNNVRKTLLVDIL